MRQSIFNCVLSSLLLLSFTGSAQKNPVDSTKNRLKIPTGIRLGTDLIMIGTTAFSSNFSGWEVNADVDFGRYYLAADYGSWAREQTMRNGFYSTDGNYFRVGADVNFLLKDPDRNMVFFGLRYGHSNYLEEVTYTDSASYFPRYDATESNNATASWLELVGGLKVKIWKGFWMGYTARMKMLPSVGGDKNFETYEIPGYGLTFRNVYWGFNYQVFWRIPIKKAP